MRAVSPIYEIDSLGSSVRNALTTVRPPMPESKTPIGLAPAVDSSFVIALFTGADRDRGRMMMLLLRRRVGPQRFGDRAAVRRQVYFRHREARARRTIIDRGIVILDAQG